MSAVYRRLETAEVLTIDGETLILNQETFAVTKLNGTGGLIWDLMGGEQTMEQLAHGLSAKYSEVNPDEIRADVQRFLQQMKEIGLIQVE